MRFFVCAVLVSLWMSASACVHAAAVQPPGCEPYPLEFDAHRPLTRAERIERMDEVFYDSLSRYEGCHTKVDAPQADAVGGEEDAAGGGSEVDGAEGGARVDSVGARGVKGTEEAMDGTEESVEQPPAPGSGKVPEDISNVENDDVIAQQIRKAAMAESDPVIRERLWDEYRRYKGLQ